MSIVSVSVNAGSIISVSVIVSVTEISLLPRAKFHVYRSNISPLWGKKPTFGPLSKNNTGMAALCTGLPVMMSEFVKRKIDGRQMRCIVALA